MGGSESSLARLDQRVVPYKETITKCNPGKMLVISESKSAITEYFHGILDKAQAAKKIVKACAIGASIYLGGKYGSQIGGYIGAFFGPFGVTVGSLAGFGAGMLAGWFSSYYLMDQIFGKCPAQSIKKAYRYFGLDPKASDRAINQAYRFKCRELHPDKNDDKETAKELFLICNTHYEVLRHARKMGREVPARELDNLIKSQ